MKKKYSGKDIDIFVLTYNRAEFLRHTLDNLLAQTALGLQITVIDNFSSDGTQILLEEYSAKGVKYLRNSENFGWIGNFNRAPELSAREWTLVFHDDDLLHPNYCELALHELNQDSQVSLVASGLSFDHFPDNNWEEKNTELNRQSCTVNELAHHLYKGFPLSFASVIYKTSFLKACHWDGARYGKIADRPFVLDVARNGKAVIFFDSLVKYRVHKCQDSQSSETGPFADQLAALHRLYYDYLGGNLLKKTGRSFNFNNYRLLKDEYQRLSFKDRQIFISFEGYWKYIYGLAGATSLAKYVGVFFFWIELLKFPIFKKIKSVLMKFT